MPPARQEPSGSPAGQRTVPFRRAIGPSAGDYSAGVGDVPYTVFAVPVVIVVAFALAMLWRRRMLNRIQRDFGELLLGDLARRLRLNIVEGDPDLNLATIHLTHDWTQYTPTGSRYRRLAGDGTKLTRVRLLGEPYGHPTEFVYHERTDAEQSVSSTTLRTWFECRLSVGVPVAFPPFEIVLAKPARHLEAEPELPLPPVPFGDPGLDATLRLCSSEPAVGPVLAPAAAPLVSFGFVHIVGQDGLLSAVSTRSGSGVAVAHLEQAQAVLERMAQLLTAGPARRPN